MGPRSSGPDFQRLALKAVSIFLMIFRISGRQLFYQDFLECGRSTEGGIEIGDGRM